MRIDEDDHDGERRVARSWETAEGSSCDHEQRPLVSSWRGEILVLIETDSEVVKKHVAREKSDKEIMREIQAFIRLPSITYLPCLDEPFTSIEKETSKCLRLNLFRMMKTLWKPKKGFGIWPGY